MTARRVLAALGVAALIAAALLIYLRRAPDAAGPVAHAPSPIPRVRLAELRHQAPAVVSGSVRSATGAVAGATVCARAADGTPDGTAEPRCTASAADGGWELAALPPAAYAIWASAPGQGGAATTLTLAAGEEHGGVELRLLAGAVEVRGLVRDARGAPIAGAQVQLGGRAAPLYATRTGTDGAFAAWARPGELRVTTSAEGFVDDDAVVVAPATDVVLTLTPGGALAGTVIDAATGAPAPEADVDAPGGERVHTDAAGRFRIGKLPPGRYKPIATAIGGYGEARESVRLGLGATVAGIVIELHPVAVVAGHVVIAEGGGGTSRACPAGDGEVQLARYGSTADYRARTLDDGLILLEGVVPGTYGVTARCAHWLSAVPYADLIVGDSDVDDVTWTVTPSARITGRVRGRAGEPIAGAVINIRAADGVSFASAESGGDGAFTADGLGAGVATVEAEADGYVPSDPPVELPVTAGSAARCELVLDRGGAVAGTVTDELGAPVANARVLATGLAPGEDRAVSDRSGRDGTFRLDALPPGTYRIAAESEYDEPPDAARAVTVAVTAGATAAANLTLPTVSGVIEGRVVDGSGGPIGDAYVTAMLEDPDRGGELPVRYGWTSPPQLAGADGAFRLTALPHGVFGVRAYRPGGGEATVRHVALGGHPVIAIQATGTLAGTVVAATGAPVTDVLIAAEDRDHGVAREERAYFTGGQFALHDLPAGTYKITADGDPGSAIRVALGDGEQRTDLRLVAQPRYTLRGRVVSAAGAPLAAWRVEVDRTQSIDRGSDARFIQTASVEVAVTGADGVFTIHDLPAGDTTISAFDVHRSPDAPAVVVRPIALAGAAAVIDAGDVVTP